MFAYQDRQYKHNADDQAKNVDGDFRLSGNKRCLALIL